MSTESVRAIVIPSYGSLDRFAPLAIPMQPPGSGEVRVRVHASALNPADYKVALGKSKFLHGRNFPMILGYDFSGVIEAVGPNAGTYKSGDAVFGFVPYGGSNRCGTFIEALNVRFDAIALKPSAVSHIQAAASATAALTVLQSLRDIGRLPAKNGRVLITGVSGGVGSLGVAIAGRLGATVEAIGSGPGLELARSLGAARIIDRTKGDPVAAAQGPFDVVFDAAAAYRWSQWRGKLKPGGAFVTTLPSLALVADKLTSLLSASRVGFIMVKSKPADLKLVGEWLASGLTVPIDSTIPVRDVGAGMAKLMTGKVQGRLAVDVANGF